MQNLAKNSFTQFELSKLLITSKFFSKIKVSPSARLVLIVLCSHYPRMYPSIKTIQEESGIASKTSVISSLKELSGLGFILYETKNVNHYSFTSYFFESLKVEPERYENWNCDSTKNEHKQINYQNNNKNNNFKIFSEEKRKQPKYYHNNHIKGINYPKYKPLNNKKESPLDMDKKQATEFIKNLPLNLQNSFFARELKKKWEL